MTEIDGTGRDRVVSVFIIDLEEAVDTVGFIPFGEDTWAKNAEATFSTIDMSDLNTTCTYVIFTLVTHRLFSRQMSRGICQLV